MSSVSLNTSQVANFLNAYNNSVKPSQTQNNPKQLQDEQAELAPLTSEVLVSMGNFIMEEPLKEYMNVDDMLSLIFAGDKSLGDLAKVFTGNKSTIDSKELILARFAMKFLFDKILDQNNPKMAEVVNILNNNNDLKDAVEQVLSALDDKSAINRFKKVLEPKNVVNQPEIVSQEQVASKVAKVVETSISKVAMANPYVNYRDAFNIAQEANVYRISAEGHLSKGRSIDSVSKPTIAEFEVARDEFKSSRGDISKFRTKRQEFINLLNKIMKSKGLSENDIKMLQRYEQAVSTVGLKVFIVGKRLQDTLSINENGDMQINRDDLEYNDTVDRIIAEKKCSIQEARQFADKLIISTHAILELLRIDKGFAESDEDMNN